MLSGSLLGGVEVAQAYLPAAGRRLLDHALGLQRL